MPGTNLEKTAQNDWRDVERNASQLPPFLFDVIFTFISRHITFRHVPIADRKYKLSAVNREKSS